MARLMVHSNLRLASRTLSFCCGISSTAVNGPWALAGHTAVQSDQPRSLNTVIRELREHWSPATTLQQQHAGYWTSSTCLSADAGSSQPSVVSFPLAQTGEGISECELMQWFVKEGDVVEEFQPICEVQSDKAAIEITSRYAGTILKVHHSQGDLIKVGAPLVDIQTAGAAAGGNTTASATSSSGEESSGTTAESYDYDPSAPGSSATGSSAVLAAPTVRRLARELGVDLAKVSGSGPRGRVLKEDVERFKSGLVSSIADKLVDRIAAKAGPSSTGKLYAELGDVAADEAGAGASSATAGTAAAGAASQAAAATAAGGAPQVTTRIPIRSYRRAMVKSATEAGSIPTFHYMDELNVDELLGLRALLKDDPALEDVKLTFLPFVVKALSLTLAKYPGLNTSLEPGGAAVLQHHSHNIGVAMATSNGLVVPNVKQVEKRSIPEIARELAHLQQLAAAGKLSTEDVTHGSITISNIGTVGGTNATPMLNPPEVAIVALGRVQALPRYDATGEQLMKKHLMSVSWGGDHRVVDGAAIAEFSNYWKHLLEEPARLLMHMR